MTLVPIVAVTRNLYADWMPLKEQKAQKAFGLRDCRDLIKKLHWELDNLFCRQRHDVEACQYHAFNCAVTAWHATDWLFWDVSEKSKDRLNRLITTNNGKTTDLYRKFQAYIRDACPSLRLCEQVANGSKHCKLTMKPDTKVSALMSDGDGYDYGNPIIMDGPSRHGAGEVFYEALFWLEAFVRDWQLFPEEPFVPSGDKP